jgi:hypothetical protein
MNRHQQGKNAVKLDARPRGNVLTYEASRDGRHTKYRRGDKASALGASANNSTGDDGDFSVASKGEFTSVSAPAISPFATAVGGTSLFLNSAKTKINLQTGWGNNETRIVNRVTEGSTPVKPPLNLGFVFGAGGGASEVFAKPSYQRSLPGSARMIPDISYVADPFTGVEIILTDPTARPPHETDSPIRPTSRKIATFVAICPNLNYPAVLPPRGNS